MKMKKRPAYYVITCIRCKGKLGYMVDEIEMTILIDPCQDCIEDGIDDAIEFEGYRSRFCDK